MKDVAHVFYLAMQSEDTYGPYNMTSRKGVTLQQQAEIIQAEIIAELRAPSPECISKIVYKPEVKNNTASYLFSMEKAKKDFGYVPQSSDFKIMMQDYKKDLNENKYQELFNYVK